MATQTPYFGLSKPAGIEAAHVGPLNANFDILDTELWMSFVRAAINLAPIYDETSSYVEGDYCTKLITIDQTVTGFHLYKCTTDTTDPAGTFDPNSWSEVDITSEMGHGGGGGGGHTYIGNDGSTAMTQRDNAQFVGAYMEDDSSNDITKVNVMRSMHHADFEQLSDAEKKGIIFVDDETGAVEDKFQPVIYSTEEREIGVWTDGKPLYQKTWDVGSDKTISRDSFTTVSEIQIPDVETVVYCEGVKSDGKLTHGTLLCNVTDYPDIKFQTLRNGSTSLVQYFTIRYTKSTDTAGSGQWTPQGVPTVHYSTAEQLVGTYHGEPLYQRDIDIPLEDSSDMQTFTGVSLGIGQVKVVVDGYFKNSGNQQLRQSSWYGNDYWSYIITSASNILVKRQTSDSNWTTGVHFVATVQYTKESS